MSSSGLVTSAISNESTKEPKERLLGHGESLTAPDVVVVVTVPDVLSRDVHRSGRDVSALSRSSIVCRGVLADDASHPEVSESIFTTANVVVVVTVPNVVDGGHRRNISGSSSACTLVSKQNDLC